jgi:hypothetical protein
MNAELVSQNEARIIIPTVFRINYLNALKSLSHNGSSQALIKVLDFAQNYTSQINWSHYEKAKKQLLETNAFQDPYEADQLGSHLTLP